jgi:hypothetical protein
VTDPVASFKPWPIDIRVGSDTVSIPAMDASEWLSLLMDQEVHPDDIFPGLLPDDESRLVEQALWDEKISVQDLQDLTFQIIASASGRPWWVALRLILSVKANWDSLGGEFAFRSIDPTRLSLAGWLDAAQLIMLRAIGDNTKVNSFLMKLEKPPPGHEPVAPEQAIDANDFLSMM